MNPLRSVVVAAAIVASGCTLLFANNLDDADKGGPTADGGSSSSSSSGARADAAPPGPKEAGASSGEAAAPFGCAAYQPAPKFCDDFDRGLSSEWTQNPQGGTVGLDSTLFVSPPSSFVAHMSTKQDCQYTRIERTFSNVGTKQLAVNVKIRPKLPWVIDGDTPLVVETRSATKDTYCAALFYIGTNGGTTPVSSAVNMQSNGVPNDVRDMNGTLTGDEWTDFGVVITPGASGGLHWNFEYTAAGGSTKESSQDYPYCDPWTELEIDVGFHCVTGNDTAYYDDVRVDWQ